MIKKILIGIAVVFLSVQLGICQSAKSKNKNFQKRCFTRTGTFIDSAVSGLQYTGDFRSGITDKIGQFKYRNNEPITFSIGDLVLGTTLGKNIITPLDLFEDAAGAADPRVNNMLSLLQTLDKNGDLNDGIQITQEISNIVSTYAGLILFDQPTADFAADTNVAALLNELNTAGVFTDLDPRPRTLRKSLAALEHFQRATSERKIIRTKKGFVKGFAANDSTWQFLGIPYAKPPVGDLRWRPPQKMKKWCGVRDAIAWGDQAAQSFEMEQYGEGGMSEDCLYLNVTVPKNARNLPVMVWFHGGSFTILTGNTKGYNNINALTTKDVILVTVVHRLGPFGYLAHPLLAEESEYGGSGNYGQMDLTAALKWINQNIKHFGGNPDNVTIFGQSGGGAKSASLMMSPLAKGLFHKAIIMAGIGPVSPSDTPENSVATAEAIGQAVFERNMVSTLEEARGLAWTQIIQADKDYNIPRETYRPNVDYYSIPDTYYSTLINGQPNDVPLMIGCTAMDYPSIIYGMKQQMPIRSDYGSSDLFVYKFNRVPTGWNELGLRSNHGGEIPYLFNFPATFVNNYYFGLILDPATSKPFPNVGNPNVFASLKWGAEDMAMADITMNIWSNFAKFGNPSVQGLVEWPKYTTESDSYVEIGQDSVTVKTGLNTAFP